jgi:ATP synthase protein I
VDPEAKKMWAIAGSTGAVGIETAAAIGIGYFGGHYLDQKLGTAPWLTWVGFGAGVGAAIKAMIRVVRSYQKSLQEEPPEKK